jgi:hypothetical protein
LRIIADRLARSFGALATTTFVASALMVFAAPRIVAQGPSSALRQPAAAIARNAHVAHLQQRTTQGEPAAIVGGIVGAVVGAAIATAFVIADRNDRDGAHPSLLVIPGTALLFAIPGAVIGALFFGKGHSPP